MNDILNPGCITIEGVSIFNGTGIIALDEYIVLTPQTLKMHNNCPGGYNFTKFWRKKKVNTSRLKSVIRK